MAYVKLFSDILASTIWAESDTTRIVWITMLAMSDRDGMVQASCPGLAHFARVDVDACEKALNVLASPDPHSRTKDFDGRRIAAVPGGWSILNYETHRDRATLDERREKDRLRQERKRIRDAAKKSRDVTSVTDCNDPSRSVTPSDADADADADNPPTPRKRGAAPPALVLPPILEPARTAIESWLAYKAEKGKLYKNIGLKALITKLEAWGPSRTSAAIQHSMASGWDGLFEQIESMNANSVHKSLPPLPQYKPLPGPRIAPPPNLMQMLEAEKAKASRTGKES